MTARTDPTAKQQEPPPLVNAHAASVEAALAALDASMAGLSQAEVARRRARWGANTLRRILPRSVWAMLIDQIRSVVVWLLAAAAAVSFAFGHWTEGSAILLVLVINTAIGFVTELRAARSMEGLRQLVRTSAVVRRDGNVAVIPAEDLVPGDIVMLEGGDVVSADLRLVESANLQCDESTFTGESAPVEKTVAPTPEDTPLADRSSMVFNGTSVTNGVGQGVVTATGMATELGRIAALVEAAESDRSPLQKRLERLGRQLVWATAAITVLIFLTGVLRGREALEMLRTAIALAVAAVPEGLPVVATAALARSMWRMAARNVLIRKLSAVETLGATTLILTDKTGTLTENRMSAVRLVLADGALGHQQLTSGEQRPQTATLAAAMRAAVLCNNATLPPLGEDGPGVGDPTELALLAAARDAGADAGLDTRYPREVQEAFNSQTKMMATLHRDGEGWLVAAKGAPEALIGRASHILTEAGAAPLDDAARSEWLERGQDLAASGLRVIAVAERRTTTRPADLYEDLTLIGLFGLLDPPRPDVRDAVAACRAAGVRVVMLTGDHLATATAVAEAIGMAEPGGVAAIEASRLQDLEQLAPESREQLRDAVIFARISPHAKLQVVELHQSRREVVAMTGDGVNDAPALRQADIGVAMGRRGTQVAREAADMVLRDDAFPSVVAAIREGRIVYGNIRKFAIYLLSCNISEIVVVGLAAAVALPQPLLALQILYLNLVTDVFPAFALGFGEGDRSILNRPPRDPRAPLLDARRWAAIVGFGTTIAAATLGAFLAALQLLEHQEQAVTVAFLTIALAQLWHVFNMRDRGSHLLVNEVTRNPYVWAALVLCLGLIAAAVQLPALASVLGLTPPGWRGWALAVAASLVTLVLGQAVKGRPRSSPVGDGTSVLSSS